MIEGPDDRVHPGVTVDWNSSCAHGSSTLAGLRSCCPNRRQAALPRPPPADGRQRDWLRARDGGRAAVKTTRRLKAHEYRYVNRAAKRVSAVPRTVKSLNSSPGRSAKIWEFHVPDNRRLLMDGGVTISTDSPSASPALRIGWKEIYV